MAMAAIDRRRFFGAVVLIGTLLAVRPRGVLGRVKRNAVSPEEAVAQALTRIVTDRRSARKVGIEYLRGAPEERDPWRLVARLRAPWPEESLEVALASPGKLKELVASRVRDDFENGRTVSVGGWVLARTEARLYALTALL